MRKKLTPRQLKSIETRKTIFQAVCRLVNQDDGGFTVQDICSEAGVSNGTFYHYYKSKEGVLEDYYPIFNEEIERISETLPEEPEPRITGILKAMIQYSVEQGIAFQKFAFTYIGGSGAEHGMVERSSSMDILCDSLAKGVQSGRFTCPKGTEYYARLLITIFQGTLHWWTETGGGFDAVERIQSYTEDILRLITIQ